MIDVEANAEFPFGLLLERLQLRQKQQDDCHAPLFQVTLKYLSAQSSHSPHISANLMSALSIGESFRVTKFGPFQFEPIRTVVRASIYDLQLLVTEIDRKLVCKWIFSCDLFRPSTVERMAGHFAMLLQSIVNSPDLKLTDLKVMSEDERDMVLHKWNSIRLSVPAEKLVHELVEEQV